MQNHVGYEQCQEVYNK